MPIDTVAGTPGSPARTVALPKTPFGAVAVIVAVPGATPVTSPVAPSTVATPSLLLVQASVAVARRPSSSSAVAVSVFVAPTRIVVPLTAIVATGPAGTTGPYSPAPGVPRLIPGP